ncbi:DUF4276 family protein [Methanotrichaceae archaeon M04Ac]|jgi:hypothetical protein|uniref:DUF4276 family protein n=1 Tax=Candidatus Methanocrinis alkalitolerans TaxID=3033395 RepID=A0ABT5XBY6_9EURY|nr:DUF4276 family protein [Candidatus Methanocrinis alkalitolerans]MCR3883049.1 DUF4276 family protein [Methanothrix sp.]MDF0592214.1 DUF4276 family protein [Candidatus Methanocrinis alkalitolerans]
MVSVRIYIEGGGDSKDLQSRCREGFRKLIEKTGFEGRMPSTVACGGRNNAYDMFKIALRSADVNEFPMLLVDSEEPVTMAPWDHLKSRDGWDRPAGAEDDQAQMMVTCMETWIMADRGALRKVFGVHLRESALFPVEGLERRSRQDLLAALKNATEDCGRGKGYDKGRRSFQILSELDPEMLKENLSYFRRFSETLDRYLRQIG